MFFFFNDTATTEIYTLSLHDALPIFRASKKCLGALLPTTSTRISPAVLSSAAAIEIRVRSEEHTSELQSLTNLVCRLLLEKKKTHTWPTFLISTAHVLQAKRSTPLAC